MERFCPTKAAIPLFHAFKFFTGIPMFIEVFKSKIHRVRVTEANLNYVGSITIDEDLLEAANILVGE